jgi:hypothetical protein
MFLTPITGLNLPDNNNPRCAADFPAEGNRAGSLDHDYVRTGFPGDRRAVCKHAELARFDHGSQSARTQVDRIQHRKSAERAGENLGNAGFGFVLGMITANAAEPNNYVYTLSSSSSVSCRRPFAIS